MKLFKFDRRFNFHYGFDITILPFGFGWVREYAPADKSLEYHCLLAMKSVAPNELKFLKTHILGPLWTIDKSQMDLWPKALPSDWIISKNRKILELQKERDQWHRDYIAEKTNRRMEEIVDWNRFELSGMHSVLCLLFPHDRIDEHWKPSEDDIQRVVDEIKRLKSLDHP
jgi:hypothetical protein